MEILIKLIKTEPIIIFMMVYQRTNLQDEKYVGKKGSKKEHGMSNLWLNIRFGQYHLQIGDPKWWSIRIRKNDDIKSKPWFQVFQFPFKGGRG